MSEYLKLFQRLTTAIELFLQSESSSLELKLSAVKLEETMQPCLKELQESATRLSGLLQPCFDELHHAEFIWESKPGIAAASDIEIREQVGNLSGCILKIQILNNQIKLKAVEQAQKVWQTQLSCVKDEWFVDKKTGNLKGVNPLEKEQFIQALRRKLEVYERELELILKSTLQPLLELSASIKLEQITFHLNLLDEQARNKYHNLIYLLDNSKIESRLKEPFSYIPESIGVRKIWDVINPLIERLVDQGFLIKNLPGKAAIKSILGQGIVPTTWEHLSEFSNELIFDVDKVVKSIIEDRAKLLSNIFEGCIEFYSNFLEIQQRYKQETLEQRKLEKNWLLSRRQDLEKLKKDFEEVIQYVALS